MGGGTKAMAHAVAMVVLSIDEKNAIMEKLLQRDENAIQEILGGVRRADAADAAKAANDAGLAFTATAAAEQAAMKGGLVRLLRRQQKQQRWLWRHPATAHPRPMLNFARIMRMR